MTKLKHDPQGTCIPEQIRDKKYGFSGETMTISTEHGSIILHQIVALKDFAHIKKGYVGGYIQSEHNLSQEGHCWVDKGCNVYGNASVRNNAIIQIEVTLYDDVCVKNDAIISGFVIISGLATIADTAKILGYYIYISGQCNRIYSNAKIIKGVDTCINMFGKVSIGRDAMIKSPEDLITISNVGSRSDCITFYKNTHEGISVCAGCFNDNIDEFKKAVKKTHRDNKYAIEYGAIIDMVETRFDVRGRTKTTTIPLSPTAEEHEYEIKLNGKMKTKIESGV